MPSDRRKKVVASRRRREDEGEEEGSVVADLEDDSLSEGSIISNGDDDADIEPSDMSDEEIVKAHHTETGAAQPNPSLPSERKHEEPKARATDPKFVSSSDTKAMMNGLKPDDGEKVPPIQFGDTMHDSAESGVEDSRSQTKASRETPAERSRREHVEYLKQKKENPAFVPNRGGFFLHDNRAAPPGPYAFRAPARARGRGGFSGLQPRYVCSSNCIDEEGKLIRGSRVPPFAEPTDQPWAHDLHDSVSAVEMRKSNTSETLPNTATAQASTLLPPPGQDVPNRSFSTSVLLGKVPVVIHLQGMQEKVTVQNVAKKKHTLLPKHRPPLRRDKPVRVSLPNLQPRYIFPSTERSFIFIPRALRPNQQGFGRGRGRNSFNPSRRTSVYGGSSYTPSLVMSRRSSLAGVTSADGVRSPGAAALPLPPGYVADPGKPVVRFPAAARQIAVLPLTATSNVNGAGNTVFPVQPVLHSHGRQENVANPLTMHQPRPQKTVSVADIESPARFHFNPPQQQQEQPFHQQMPLPAANPPIYAEDGTGYNPQARRPSHVSRPSGTPLSQIPERAVYAQPFQPFPLPPGAQGYMAPSYAPGTVFFPAVQSDLAPYGSGMGPSTMPPAFLTGPHAPPYVVPAAPLPAPGPADGNPAAGTVAHESNGMVYYYDSAQFPPSAGPSYSAPFAGAPVGGVVGMGGMMTPPNHFFYPPSDNGVYYAAP
jgi:CASC3/Barentsz eIF4AIII binding